MSLLSLHLKEVRLRTFFLGLSFVSCLGISFCDSPSVLFVFVKPLWITATISFMYTHALEGFQASFLAHVLISFMFFLPFGVYQVWAFFSPSLYIYEKRRLTLLCLSCFLFILGVGTLFYRVLLPLGCQFFLSFQNEMVVMQPKILDYLTFLMNFWMVVLVVCVLPFVFFGLATFFRFTPVQIQSQRPWVVIGCLLMAGLVTPPDLVSQSVCAFLFLLGFEAFLFCFWTAYCAQSSPSDQIN
uniref:SecY-independent transporter protein n=1 Tax=Chloropicon maureeniae TaxID=1461542 RepID=A0A4D6C549_9CHLO|nr:SecY-independent transporter protein [Chloropicon maureeniae]QBX98804.1 SecY-independent transporter protein [Chloropicon maureeniae]